jgi:hypothetical protein
VKLLVRIRKKQESDITFGWKISWKIATFQVFTAVKIQVEVCWVLMPYSDVVGYKRFGGPCCLHLQGKSGYRYLVWNTEHPC